MTKPSAFYLVYNDVNGSFVNIHDILTVEAYGDGAVINTKTGKELYSPFKPRTILHKIRIIRHNLRLESNARRSGNKSPPVIPEK